MRKVARIGLILFIVLFLVFGLLFLKELRIQQQEVSEFAELTQLIIPQIADPATREESVTPSKPETATHRDLTPSKPETATHRDLTPLFEQNSDCIGWIYIDDTQVNYPVMHTPEDPQRYLRRNFYRESSNSGVPFLDGSCTVESDNLIIYGHNMKNGTMFANITEYKDSDYTSQHPVIEFDTAGGCKRFAVFAVVQVKKNDSWYSFRRAKNREEYDSAIAQIKERALYDTGITPVFGDQLLTLSTCYGKSKDDRIIVIGAEKKE